MSSQASSSGRDEAKVRRKIIETGHVDMMIAIRSNFFYTRSVPCELWFIDRGKPDDLPDQSSRPLNTKSKVLMIDARNVYRQVTRKICDFSPEQMKNLTSIVWLYRGQKERFLSLVAEYMDKAVRKAGETFKPLEGFKKGTDTLMNVMEPFLSSLSKDDAHGETLADLKKSREVFGKDIEAFQDAVKSANAAWTSAGRDNEGLKRFSEDFVPVAGKSRELGRQTDRPNIQDRTSPH
jgi:type I restriction enzyme M protein